MTTEAQRNANAAAQAEARQIADNDYYGPHEPAPVKVVKAQAQVLWERLTDNLGKAVKSANELQQWQHDLNLLYSLAQRAHAQDAARRKVRDTIARQLADLDQMDSDRAGVVADAIVQGEIDRVHVDY